MDGRAAEYLATARRRVAMGDVDAAGILYFAAPYRWLEELFTGWLKDAGHPVSAMLRSQVACPCVASAATYLAPLSLDDEITLTLQPSSVEHRHHLLRGDRGGAAGGRRRSRGSSHRLACLGSLRRSGSPEHLPTGTAGVAAERTGLDRIDAALHLRALARVTRCPANLSCLGGTLVDGPPVGLVVARDVDPGEPGRPGPGCRPDHGDV